MGSAAGAPSRLFLAVGHPCRDDSSRSELRIWELRIWGRGGRRRGWTSFTQLSELYNLSACGSPRPYLTPLDSLHHQRFQGTLPVSFGSAGGMSIL